MKNFIITATMFVLAVVNAQASVITLKDGRTVTGDIIQQDDAKVVLKSGNYSLTYYKDEIVSIKEAPSITSDNVAGTEADKDKLIQQYLIFYPTRSLVSEFVEGFVPPDKRQAVLSVLNDDQNISALTRFRIQGLKRYFSLPDLRIMNNLLSFPVGKQFLKDSTKLQGRMTIPLFHKMGQEARKAIKGLEG